MTEQQEAKLARLHNHGTRYEVVLTDGTKSFLVCYAHNVSFASVIAAAHERIDAILAATGDIVPYVAHNKNAKFIPGEWRVVRSHRTQRQAILEGELPFIGHTAA